MAPHPGIDTDAIRSKARKDLLDLLESVCKAARAPGVSRTEYSHLLGPGQEESGHRTVVGRSNRSLRKIFNASRTWR